MNIFASIFGTALPIQLLLALMLLGTKQIQACEIATVEKIVKFNSASEWKKVMSSSIDLSQSIEIATSEESKNTCLAILRHRYHAEMMLGKTEDSYLSRLQEISLLKRWHGKNAIAQLEVMDRLLLWIRSSALHLLARKDEFLKLAEQHLENTERIVPNSSLSLLARYRLGALRYHYGPLGTAEVLFLQVDNANRQKHLLNEKQEDELSQMLISTLNLLRKNPLAAQYQALELDSIERKGETGSIKHVSALISMASLLSQANGYEKSINFSSRAVQLARTMTIQNENIYGAALTQHIVSLRELGRASEAETFTTELLVVFSKVNSHSLSFAAASQWMYCLFSAGRSREGTKLLHSRLEFARASNFTGEIEVLLDRMASNVAESGSPTEQMRAALELISIYSKQGESGAGRLERAYFNLSTALGLLNRPDDALEALEKSFEVSSKYWGDAHLIGYFSKRAEYLFALKRIEEALVSKRKYIELLRERNGDHNFSTIEAIADLASNYSGYGKIEEGLLLSGVAVDAVDSLYDEYRFVDTTNLRQMFARYDKIYRLHVTQLLQAGRHRDAFFFIERTKARSASFLTMQATAFSDQFLTNSERTELNRTREKISSSDAAIAIAETEKERMYAIETRTSLTNTIRHQVDTILASRNVTGLSGTGVGPGDVAWMGKDTRFVSIYRIDPVNYGVFILDSDGQVTTHSIRPLQRIGATAETFATLPRGLLGTDLLNEMGIPLRVSKKIVNGDFFWTLEADDGRCQQNLKSQTPQGCTSIEKRKDERQRELDEITTYFGHTFIDPIWPRLTEAKKIIISNDSSLSLIPWDMVKHEGKALVENFAISQVPNLWVAKQIHQRLEVHRTKGPQRKPLLSFGNAEYRDTEEGELTRSCAELRSVQNVPQKTMKVKGNTLNGYWPNLDWSHCELDGALRAAGGTIGNLIERKAASEVRLKEMSRSGALAQYRTILFSAHGQFSTTLPLMSGLIFQKSGITPETDGMVTMGDWANLRFDSDLIVLSGCNSGRGEVIEGDGTMGMTTALLAAGNANSIASLWAINDEGAAEFVLSFFTELQKDQNAASALWRTKQRFMKHENLAYRNPAVWAAFTLFGI